MSIQVGRAVEVMGIFPFKSGQWYVFKTEREMFGKLTNGISSLLVVCSDFLCNFVANQFPTPLMADHWTVQIFFDVDVLIVD